MFKNCGKFGLLFALLLVGQASFADFGIPLWVTNAPTLLACFSYGGSIVGDITAFFILFAIVLVLLLFVTLVEAFIAKFILKNTKFLKLFRIFYLANLVSTLIGAIAVSAPMFINYKLTMPLLILGPWAKLMWIPAGLAIILMNVTLLIISYFIEYNVGKKWLKQDYEIKKIKKAFIIANIVTYSLSILLYVPWTWWEISDYWQKANYNLKNDAGNMPNIDNIEFILPITRPEPLSYEDCQSELKRLGVDNSNCSHETYRNYWAGAVKMCGGVDYMLSGEQIKELFGNMLVQNKDNDYDYNTEMLKKYNLSINDLDNTVKYLKESDEFQKHSYGSYGKIDAGYLCFYTKADNNSNLYPEAVMCGCGRRLGFSTIFALCTKEKNVPKKTKFTFKDYWNEYKKYVKDKDYQFYEKGRHYFTSDEEFDEYIKNGSSEF